MRFIGRNAFNKQFRFFIVSCIFYFMDTYDINELYYRVNYRRDSINIFSIKINYRTLQISIYFLLCKHRQFTVSSL